MAKPKVYYVCSECGCRQPKWLGKCPDCGSWNTMTEELEEIVKPNSKLSAPKISSVEADSKIQILDTIDFDEKQRIMTEINEFNRVCGGGIVEGSVILLSGDPGIGKSTLLLQICKSLQGNKNILYVSGEESAKQIKLRANRLGVFSSTLQICSSTDIETIISIIHTKKPDIVMIDSIQTMYYSALSSSCGSVSQVRQCTQLLIETAKSLDIATFIVGHVNKDGAIAGPKVMEHMVDAVLYFEGEKQMPYRILRAIKNRYGSTNEIGVFEMTDMGLCEVSNPSMAMLSGRPFDVSGTCISCVMEGTRPILAEVQALVSKSGFPSPRRMATGFDYNRMSLLIAVLEKRAGYYFGNLDVYINVIGGLRLDEPAADLSVVMALVSNLLDRPIEEGLVSIGEVGLTGEIRSVNHIVQRVNEAQRLGFKRVLVPKQCLKSLNFDNLTIDVCGISGIKEALRYIGPSSN